MIHSLETSNWINPFLVVIKTTRSEEVTGDVAPFLERACTGLPKFNIENVKKLGSGKRERMAEQKQAS